MSRHEDGGMCFWMDRFGGFGELMFRVVMCQIRKNYTSAEIHLVDVEVLSFDFRPCTAFAGEVFDKANWNVVLDSLTSDFRTVRKNKTQVSP